MGQVPIPFSKSKNMSKKVEEFVKQIYLNLLRKKSNYDIKYNRVIITMKRCIDDEKVDRRNRTIQ